MEEKKVLGTEESAAPQEEKKERHGKWNHGRS